MTKQLIILVALLVSNFFASAQTEYKLAKSSGHLKISLSGVTIEGYEGKDIIFSGQAVPASETDERAKGLVALSSSKFIDNTGLGLNVSENGNEVSVTSTNKKPKGVITIKVPQNIKVSVINNGFNFGSASNSKAEDIIVKNLKSEIEISVYANTIRLENNTGPMNVKTVSGSVDAIFNADIKGPVSIISANDYVDVTLPAATKANVELASSYGKIYAGKDFKIDIEKTEDNDRVNIQSGTRLLNSSRGGNKVVPDTIRLATTKSNGKDVVVSYGNGTVKANGTTIYANGAAVATGTGYSDLRTATRLEGATSIFFNSGERIKGKLNGGGIDLIFKSTSKNVYIREK
ncbi:MAG: hypothetical protein EOO90_08625 [Pedobacter sp.]|nr:MAG: hypothetical protein EOO90_08625 [Pedobacter sp.]